jgi:predicted MPP superfamily phosphohydrolase
MPTTLKMICHKMDHPEGIELYGLSDLHVGSREFDEASFQKASRDILAAPNRYAVIVGDMIDNGIKSSVTSPYEANMQPKAQRQYAADLLHPIKDRILGIVAGNHEYRSSKDADTDPAELIAAKLGLEDIYRDSLAYLLLRVGQRSNHTKTPPTYAICLMHGSSGGALLGAGLNKADQYAAIGGADLTILGHSHKPATAPASRWECDKSKGVMVQRNYGIMICTAWLTYGGYPARKGLRPLPIALNHVVLGGDEHSMYVHQTIT